MPCVSNVKEDTEIDQDKDDNLAPGCFMGMKKAFRGCCGGGVIQKISVGKLGILIGSRQTHQKLMIFLKTFCSQNQKSRDLYSCLENRPDSTCMCAEKE